MRVYEHFITVVGDQRGANFLPILLSNLRTGFQIHLGVLETFTLRLSQLHSFHLYSANV